MGRPTITLDDDGRAHESEVDLPAFDALVMHKGRQRRSLAELGEGRLEDRISGAGIEGPLVDRTSKHHHPGSPLLRMPPEPCLESVDREQLVSEGAANGTADEVWIGHTEVEQRTEWRGRCDAVTTDRSDIDQIVGSVTDHADECPAMCITPWIVRWTGWSRAAETRPQRTAADRCDTTARGTASDAARIR